MGRLENSTLILILAEKICKSHAATLLFLFFLSPKPLHPSPFHQEKTPRYSSPPLPSPGSEREKIRSEMRPPQTPIPPWGSKSRRELQPSLLSPSYSRKPFQAAASSEHPCVRTRSLFPPFFL